MSCHEEQVTWKSAISFSLFSFFLRSLAKERRGEERDERGGKMRGEDVCGKKEDEAGWLRRSGDASRKHLQTDGSLEY